MAISTKKKNLITADWKTGAYSKTALSKKHKVDRKTIIKVLGELLPSNAGVVEVLVESEMLKNSVKNPQEKKAIEAVVVDRLKVHDISKTILNGVEKLAKGGKAQKVVTESNGEAGTSAAVIEYDLQAKDYKDLQDTVDKASLTLGVNARHSNSQVNVNTQVNQQANLQQDGFKITFVDKE